MIEIFISVCNFLNRSGLLCMYTEAKSPRNNSYTSGQKQVWYIRFKALISISILA